MNKETKIKKIEMIIDSMFKKPNEKIDSPIDQMNKCTYDEGHGFHIPIRSVFLDLQEIIKTK